MRIGILGSGLMGGKLGTLFARVGHDVTFSYARQTEKLKRLAKDAGSHARAGTPREAAQDADALLLAVHWLRMDDVLSQAGDLSGKGYCQLLAADERRQHRPRYRPHVVRLRGAGQENSRGSRRLRVQHDTQRGAVWRLRGPPQTQQAQSRLLRGRCAQQESCCRAHPRCGFEPVDAGPLRIARYTEPFALLMGQLAYEGKDGPELAYRFERFESE